MRLLFSLTMLFFLAVAGADRAAAEEFKAEKLIVEVQSNGPVAVLDRLTQNGIRDFEKVCRHIESGRQAWLVLAKMLKEGAEPEAALRLNHALARALVHSPATVMEFLAKEERYSSDSFSLDEICVAPFVGAAPVVIHTYLQQVERSLIAMPIKGRADIRELQKNCLKRVRASRQDSEMAIAADY